ncbi:MAG: choice-of-anchor L domain-containing protein, partial [Flavobacteriaceae bacterium]|nr:choice-of-anchor L domain-containing protein [Flavobacteriaceae bacterium]
MRKKLLALVFLFSLIGYSQITIDETYTTQQLIEDILIDSSCAEVSNFGQRTGTDFGDVNGIAAFDANGSGFPFAAGVILTSGNVADSGGPNTSLLSLGGVGWPGSAIIEDNTTATNTNNASVIQFDFVPFVDQISFNFIFASEEYDQNFECTYSDAFAFVLTDQITGVVQNLAVIPGTNIPIEATNIHPDVPGQCPAINEEFFDRYNFLPFNDENTAPIDYNGQTVTMTAMGSVVLGNPYTIQLAIADEGDTAYDSAVFLEAGSFNIGSVDLGVDLTEAEGTARCTGETYVIEPNLIAPPGTTYEWLYEDPIGSGTFVQFVPPEFGQTLAVTQTGNYQLNVHFGGANGCDAEGEVFIEFIDPPLINLNPLPTIVCDDNNDGLAQFELEDFDLDIALGDPLLTLTYHETLLNAENNILPLSNPHFNNVPYTDEVFVRAESASSSCYSTTRLELQVRNSPLVVAPADPLRLCDINNPGDGI